MNKRAIIMGATSGMGKGVAMGLLKDGYTIGVAGRRAEELVKIQKLYPNKVFIKIIDVTKEDAPTLLLQLINDMGGVELYFHSSGYGKQNLNLDLDIERNTVLTNALGFTQMIDTVFNYFKNNKKHGQIAIISSVAGTKGLGVAPSYSATKRYEWIYIEALSQLARIQNIDITFTDIRPGFVATDFITKSDYPMLMQTDYVVNQILRAVHKGKRKVIIDWKFAILCFFWRIIPSELWECMKIK